MKKEFVTNFMRNAKSTQNSYTKKQIFTHQHNEQNNESLNHSLKAKFLKCECEFECNWNSRADQTTHTKWRNLIRFDSIKFNLLIWLHISKTKQIEWCLRWIFETREQQQKKIQ